MTVLWSAFAPDLQPQVTGCPLPLIEHAVRRASQDFFRATRAWQVETAAQAVAASTETLDIVLPDTTEQALVRVEQVWYDGTPLTPWTLAEMDDHYSDDWGAHTGTPTGTLQLVPGTLRFYPIPAADAATGVTTRCAVMPGESATGIPDGFAYRYRAVFIDGALARLLLTRGQEWTDPKMGAALSARFADETAKATQHAATGHGRGRMASRPQWF